ncbi:MAG: hypothetical protein H7Y86_11995 [Rhizobacter sp.]|nr:hypothetical protein [Ferruginibacter sp.]
MKYCFLLVTLCTLALQKNYAQNLTGTWQGMSGDYKIVIIQVGDSCFGFTYDTGMGYCKANFEGIYNDSTKKLRGVNTSFIERTLSHGLSNYRLIYSKVGEMEYLKGTGVPKQTVAKILSFGLGSPISYRKVSGDIETTKLIAAKLPVVNPAGHLADSSKPITTGTADNKPGSIPIPNEDPKIMELGKQKETRKSQLVNTIITNADSIKLTLHDNGEIDNDTVTVFLDGKIIINQLGLTAKAFETTIPVKKDTIQSIELMANNLGSIPPNTAYLTIWSGKEKFELRVSSDYTVNARVDIKYVRKE